MALGEQLREARLSMNLTASQVAAATRMKIQIVEALEQEDFSSIAAPIYAKGFLKLYAEHVGLDPSAIVDEYVERFVDRKARTLKPEEIQPPVYEEPETSVPESSLFESSDIGVDGEVRSDKKSIINSGLASSPGCPAGKSFLDRLTDVLEGLRGLISDTSESAADQLQRVKKISLQDLKSPSGIIGIVILLVVVGSVLSSCSSCSSENETDDTGKNVRLTIEDDAIKSLIIAEPLPEPYID